MATFAQNIERNEANNLSKLEVKRYNLMNSRVFQTSNKMAENLTAKTR